MGGITLDVMKCLQKGMNNFKKAGGKMLKIEIDRMPMLTDQKLLMALRSIPDLRVITMKGLYVNYQIASILNKVLTDFKFIQELDLTDCKLNVQCGKEIADGLMRAKQMEILRLAQNPALSDAVPGIIYNLAFSPKVSLVDISDISLASKSADAVESIYKLLTISGSLKVLIMDHIGINNAFQLPFFKAIGINKTLTALSMNGNTFSNYEYFGKAIALNAKRSGSLEYFSAIEAMGSFANTRTMIDNMWVSDYDNELWYGDDSEARKMHGEQKVKKFFCGLKQFFMGKNNLSFGFHVSTLKHETYEKYPNIIKFLCENKSLQTLSFEGCYLNRYDGEVLAAGLKSDKHFSSLRVLNLAKNGLRKEGAQALATTLSEEGVQLEHLDLSGNKIGVSGAKALAAMLAKNKSLKVLNLFSNMIDVDGARALKEAFKINCTLQEIDVGLNRLREKGAKALAEGLSQNKNSAIRTLGLRFNFISDDGISEFFNMAVFSGECKLNHLYIKGNYFTEHNVLQLQKTLAEKKATLHVDIFEKIKFLTHEKLERSIWVSPVWANDPEAPNKIRTFFEEQQKVGIVIDVRLRTGPKVAGKPKPNVYALVEFAHINSVPRALRIASKKKAIIQGNRIRIYKAGTRTQAIVKPPKVRRGR